MEQAFIQYYLTELAQIEDDCAEFSREYPQVAARLTLGQEGAVDPNVRQLIEAFAFISARLKQHMDGLSGEVVCALLQLLAPNLIRPIPSMAVVRLQPARHGIDMSDTVLTAGQMVGADVGVQGSCLFSVAAEVHLWPLQVEAFWDVSNVKPAPTKTLVLRVSSMGATIPKDQLLRLNFFISGSINRSLNAAEALSLGVRSIRVSAVDASWSFSLPTQALRFPAFSGAAHRLLPTALEAENLENTLLEYFSFPQSFCFFEVADLRCSAPCKAFDISLELDEKAYASVDAGKGNFHLNCMPVVNLFHRNAVPIDLAGAPYQVEYAIPKFQGASSSWDVYKIRNVRLIRKDVDRIIPEYFTSVQYSFSSDMYWTESRRERMGNAAGSVLSFVNEKKELYDFDDAAKQVALVDLICTNAELPSLLSPGQSLNSSSCAPHYKATLEIAPSPYVDATLRHAANLGTLLKVFAFRQTHSDVNEGYTSVLKNFFKTYNRTYGQFGVLQVDALRLVVCSPLAVSAEADATGRLRLIEGVRFDLHFQHDAKQDVARYFFCRLAKKVLLQVFRHKGEQEVWMHDPVWGEVMVR